MKKWLRRIRGAIGTGITWAIGWALFGLLIGVSSLLLPGLPWHYFFDVFDAPLPALAVPGFFGGVVFSIVLGVVGRRRRFHELSLPVFAAWGAVGGLLLSLIPAAMVGLGLATLGRDELGLWKLTAVMGVPLILLSALSAAGSLRLARMGEGGRMVVSDQGAGGAGLNVGEAPELIGGGHRSLDQNPGARPQEAVRPDAVSGRRDG